MRMAKPVAALFWLDVSDRAAFCHDPGVGYL